MLSVEKSKLLRDTFRLSIKGSKLVLCEVSASQLYSAEFNGDIIYLRYSDRGVYFEPTKISVDIIDDRFSISTQPPFTQGKIKSLEFHIRIGSTFTSGSTTVDTPRVRSLRKWFRETRSSLSVDSIHDIEKVFEMLTEPTTNVAESPVKLVVKTKVSAYGKIRNRTSTSQVEGTQTEINLVLLNAYKEHLVDLEGIVSEVTLKKLFDEIWDHNTRVGITPSEYWYSVGTESVSSKGITVSYKVQSV